MILTVLFLTLLIAKLFGVLHLSWWVVAPILFVIAGLKAAKWLAFIGVIILGAFAESQK